MQKQGKWVGGKTPLGYIKDSKDKNKLIIYEPEAKIVKNIFDMAFAGEQVGVIRDYLNSNNIQTANNLRYNKETYLENKTGKIFPFKIFLKILKKSIDKNRHRCYYRKVPRKKSIKTSIKDKIYVLLVREKARKKYIKLLIFLCLKKVWKKFKKMLDKQKTA